MPIFSVIIPCYNVEKYINNCLDSVLNQTIGLENLEIILVDDASKDHTIDILKEYEARYPERIMLIVSDINQKQGTARNIGMQYATGDYISFIDADDWVDINIYKVLYIVFSQTNCDIVQFKHCHVSTYEIRETEKATSIEMYHIKSKIDVKNMIMNNSIYNLSCTTKVYKKSIIDKSGVLFAEGVIYEEPLFTYPLQFYISKICVLDQRLYYYQFNSEGTIGKCMWNPMTIYDHFTTQLSLFKFMKNKKYYNEYYHEINFHFLHSFCLEPFAFLAGRGMNMIFELFIYMKEIIQKEIPNYHDNLYIYHEIEKEMNEILQLIDESTGLSKGEIEKRFEKIYYISRKRIESDYGSIKSF